MKAILQKQMKRKLENDKESEFSVYEQRVQPYKIENNIHRKRACPEEVLASHVGEWKSQGPS